MTADKQRPIATPPAQRIEHFKQRTVPFLVWSVAALICTVLLFQRAGSHEYVGMARTQEYPVSSSAPGKLDTVHVDLYDPIEAGDVVARMDETNLLAGLETARATIQQVSAELEATRAQTQADSAQLTAELRRFQIDEEQRHLDVLALWVVIEEDEIELERLGLEVERKQPLLKAGFIDRQQYDDARLEADQVRERIELNRRLLEGVEQEHRVSQNRRMKYEADLPGADDHTLVIQPLREAINVAERRMHELEIQRRGLVLRSPVSGQVSQLLCRRGQTVAPGEPILTVAERSPYEIVAFLDETDSAHANDRVLVSRHRAPTKSAESLVLRVSPTIRALPERLWVDPRRPDYGRAVVIDGVPKLELVPGELVSVRLLD